MQQKLRPWVAASLAGDGRGSGNASRRLQLRVMLAADARRRRSQQKKVVKKTALCRRTLLNHLKTWFQQIEAMVGVKNRWYRKNSGSSK